VKYLAQRSGAAYYFDIETTSSVIKRVGAAIHLHKLTLSSRGAELILISVSPMIIVE
jgi:hypothetical protein